MGARRTLLSLAVALGVLAAAGPVLAKPAIPLGHEGRWITDAHGRVVVMHGVNMVYKRPPYAPDAIGFGADDADFLRDHGFNTVRLGTIYAGVEPEPGAYDDAYLDRILATERLLARRGIFSQIDFHQDLYNERFSGEGWPEWAVIDDGLPAEPDVGFPGNYLVMPALNRAFDHFWANDPGPGGIGLQDRYAAAWRHVAERFLARDTTMGFDLLNEPWPGSVYATCANPAGCPAFDANELTAFSKRMIAAIRQVERQKLIWFEPALTYDFGAQSSHGDVEDPAAGWSFHIYCLPGAFGGPTGAACETLEDLVFENARERSGLTGDALLLSEFGATDDLESVDRMINLADDHMMPWQWWHYCDCEEPTSQAEGDVQAVVVDPRMPPTGDNVKADKLDLLERAYPQVVAGTPLGWSYDEDPARFELTYTTDRAGGGVFRAVRTKRSRKRPKRLLSQRSPQTEIYIPRSDFPDGYEVAVDGGGIASPPKARILRIAACRGARTIRVVVAPRGSGPTTGGPDCAVAGSGQRLKVAVRPKRVPQRMGGFLVRVRTPAGRPLGGARVRMLGERMTTNGAGYASICRAPLRPGRRRATGDHRGYLAGRATVRVRRVRPLPTDIVIACRLPPGA